MMRGKKKKNHILRKYDFKPYIHPFPKPLILCRVKGQPMFSKNLIAACLNKENYLRKNVANSMNFYVVLLVIFFFKEIFEINHSVYKY